MSNSDEAIAGRFRSKRLARVHLTFEHIHPFIDGNGRIGRVVLNHLLYQLAFPPIIVRTKGKEKYYATLREFDTSGKVRPFQHHLSRLVLESMHRRIATCEVLRLRPQRMLPASVHPLERATKPGSPTGDPAFRERGVWKLPADYVSL